MGNKGKAILSMDTVADTFKMVVISLTFSFITSLWLTPVQGEYIEIMWYTCIIMDMAYALFTNILIPCIYNLNILIMQNNTTCFKIYTTHNKLSVFV